MSDSVDSTSPGGPSAADTSPTKPSLRDRDAARTGVAISEEESLFGIGDGHVPSTDATWETTEDHITQAGVLPFLTSGLPQPEPTEVMASSEPSLSGPSYTVPTHSVSHASNLHLEEDIQSVIDHPKVKKSLSWIPGFSWRDSHLLFDGQPLELPETRDVQFSGGVPGSEPELSISQRSFPHIRVLNRGHDAFQISDVAVAGVGSFISSDEHHGKDFAQDLDIISATSSSSNNTWDSEAAFRGEFIDTNQPVQYEIAVQEIVKNIVERLADYYYRSYAPQRQALAAKRKQVDRSSSSSTKNTRASIGRKGAKSTGRGQTIGGDEGSEDEEASGNGQDSSTTDTSSENSRLWACPFMKWNPGKYRGTCVKKLRDIYRLKKHLQEKHFSHYCSTCFNEFQPEELTQHEKICKSLFGYPTHQPPVGLITRDMATAINERSNTRLTSREQWERLFEIIFPHEPIPSSPYLDFDCESKLVHCYNYFHRPDVQNQAITMIQESGLGHLRKIMTKRSFEQLVCNLWDDLEIEHEISAHVASEEETVDQAQPVSTMEDHIPAESQTPPSRGTRYGQGEPKAIQPRVVINVDNTTTPIQELFADKSESGFGEDLDRLKFIDAYGSSCSEVTGTANFEETGDDPFSRPGAGDTPWYSPQETFEADPGHMRGDQTLFRV